MCRTGQRMHFYWKRFLSSEVYLTDLQNEGVCKLSMYNHTISIERNLNVYVCNLHKVFLCLDWVKMLNMNANTITTHLFVSMRIWTIPPNL